MTAITFRTVLPGDAEAIAAIYAHHVLHGTATFDIDPPPVLFWAEKIGAIAERGWPFLVAEAGGSVVGYAYVAQFRDRPAYARTCEDSIYVAPEVTGRGIGRGLLEALIDGARDCGFEQIIAVIGGAEPSSMGLHARCGFVEAGRMRAVGRKFGRTLDTVYMQRPLSG
ncbi:GNAT family N-acetyltransferase [Tsuneonella amylolytica]|uniref:GNAT family N-acetyltransferase n=1 Tax=Tsuneonella amylolytica TaxID=2338327 RepID=UPI000EA95065|nr:GNAT family N-acetyltransferase [Tsuneonella amylolytica]